MFFSHHQTQVQGNKKRGGKRVIEQGVRIPAEMVGPDIFVMSNVTQFLGDFSPLLGVRVQFYMDSQLFTPYPGSW